MIDQTERNDDHEMIWRYMSIAKFAAIIKNGHTIFFPRPFKFDDKWEGWYPPSWYNSSLNYYRQQGWDVEETKAHFRKRSLIHRYAHFVSCWHMSDYESAGMWKLYGMTDKSIAIQTTKGDLKECLRPENVGDMIYYDPSDVVNCKTMFGPSDILMKRINFSYEKEYRIWFTDDALVGKIEGGEQVDENILSAGVPKTITKFPDLLRQVVVAPGASDSFIDEVKSLCAANHLTWLARKVERSFLDRPHDSFCTS
jgi:hypothetical protein